MRANPCALRGYEAHIRSLCYTRSSRIHRAPRQQSAQLVNRFSSVVIVEFRDEAYAPIAHLLELLGVAVFRAESATELAGKMLRHSPELVLLSDNQHDESAWLTSAKLRLIDANRSVWIYSPEPPSAIDQWLSMATSRDVIVYGGVLHRLLDLLQCRLSQAGTPVDRIPEGGQQRSVA